MNIILANILIALLIPIFLVGVYLPWIRKGGYGSSVATNILITLSFSSHIFLIYKSFTDSINPLKIIFLILPLILGVLIEAHLLFKRNYHWLYQLNKLLLFSALPYYGVVVFDKSRTLTEIVDYSDPKGIMIFFYAVITTVIIQGLLLYTTFALYRKINPNAKLAYKLKLNTAQIDKGLFTKIDETLFGKNSTSFTLEQRLKKEGELENTSWKDAIKSILKYISVILFLYFYGYLIFTLD